jgi:hypothetical protein
MEIVFVLSALLNSVGFRLWMRKWHWLNFPACENNGSDCATGSGYIHPLGTFYRKNGGDGKRMPVLSI